MSPVSWQGLEEHKALSKGLKLFLTTNSRGSTTWAELMEVCEVGSKPWILRQTPLSLRC